MKTTFTGKKITGVLTVLPEKEYIYEDEITKEPEENRRLKRLKRIMGYGKRRRAKETTTVSDMFIYGAKKLLAEGKISKEEIGAIVVVTMSPDYFCPTVSAIIQGELGLDFDVQCLDISQACAGYIVGLVQSFMLLEHMEGKKVLLFTGDTFCRVSSEKEEPPSYSAPFGGDAANITIVENTGNEKIYYEFHQDGSQRNCLVIPDGAFRNPMTVEQIQHQVTRMPITSVVMDGSTVFNFAQKEVPVLINSLTDMAEISKEDIDWFLFHQPNKFMLQKLAERIKVPYEKMPMDIVGKFGNSNSATIPTAITADLKEEMLNKESLCCLAGFGAGVAWAGIIMKMGNMDFCDTIISDL